uniref:Snf2-related CREBBP activator protein n=1 Tax=Kryptolebias marmoratus TaxID=37003 RepID=A0A3Q3A3W3_KRYMA
DDEETIEVEEQQEGNDAESHQREIELLKEEGMLPLDQLLSTLKLPPPEVPPQTALDPTAALNYSEIQTHECISILLRQQRVCSRKATLWLRRRSGLNGFKSSHISFFFQFWAVNFSSVSRQKVKTPIPFLLHGTLREYQHIGLDWLVTMYEKKLNGILADEMGLGKTIQTIALLAHLIPVKILVVMLNWEMELKRWCPGFKILTYFGSQKERKLKRQGWTKPNAFHVCITSYKLVLQDHQAFRRKSWRYLILDEAQNIKNFKSQRWQSLHRRLLLTGTPLQNSLMELWSLMHFLMPHVFQSHREFKEWFSNPLTGMIEGSQEYNEGLVKRLHKVLRPFLLRRIKADVEKQMPKKYEHVVRCRLSKRQRFLYDDFMAQAS